MICGRRTYDMSIQYWGDGGPTGEARVPLFVFSHGVPDDIPEGGVYTFVDDLETALARGRETAGDKNISVMGADVGRQLLNAGAIHENSVHLVPVLFGSGTPMFGEGVDEHVTLEFVGRARARTPRICDTASSAKAAPSAGSRRDGAVLLEQHRARGLVIGFAHGGAVLPALRLGRRDGGACVPSVQRSPVPDGPFGADAGSAGSSPGPPRSAGRSPGQARRAPRGF